MYIGWSLYAGVHPAFPHERAMKLYSESLQVPALAVMLEFGNDPTLVHAFLKRYRDIDKLLEVHLTFRGQFSDKQLLTMTDTTAHRIKHLTRQAFGLVDGQEDDKTCFIICPMCEDNLSNRAWRSFTDVIADSIPYAQGYSLDNIKLCRSSLRKINVSLNADYDYIEDHHFDATYAGVPRRRIANMDGLSVNFSGKQRYYECTTPTKMLDWLLQCDALIKFIWDADMQGLGSYTGGPKPDKNKRKYIISPKAIKWMENKLW